MSEDYTLTQEKIKKKGGIIAGLVWFAAALFYFYECLVRGAPVVMMTELEAAFKITKDHLSASLSTYYFIYSPLQIFVGVLFDRFGGKRLLVPATFIVAIGCFIPILAPSSVSYMIIGRLLMGLGSAFGFVGVIYLATVWHPESRIAFLSGLTTTLGMLGAIIGLPTLAYIVESMSWQKTFLYSGYVGLFLTGFILLAIPKTPLWERKRREQHKNEFQGTKFFNVLKIVLTNPQTWIIGLIGSALYLPVVVFGELWGVEYIQKVTGVHKTVAAGTVSMLYLGWLVGGPIAGWLSDRLKTRKQLLLWGSIISAVMYGGLFLFDGVPLGVVSTVLFITGVITSVEVICFVAAYEVNPHYTKGTAIAAANMIIMIVGGAFQPIVGLILRYKATLTGTTAITPFVNTSSDYRFAMMVVPLMLLISTVLCFFMKETYAREGT